MAAEKGLADIPLCALDRCLPVCHESPTATQWSRPAQIERHPGPGIGHGMAAGLQWIHDGEEHDRIFHHQRGVRRELMQSARQSF